MAVSQKHKGFKWTVGDESNPTLALLVDNTSRALHIAEATDAGTDWNVAADTHPSIYIHSATNPATEYIKMYHDATNAYIDGVGATAMQLLIAGTAEISLTSSAFSPATSDSNALGTTALMWGDLFLASGGVINFNAGDVTITHSANSLAIAGGTSYTVDANLTPASNDGAALGTGALKFSDVYLASGSTMDFNNGDVLLTHSSNLITLAGGGLTVTAGQFISGAPIKTTKTAKSAEATLTVAEAGDIEVTADNVTMYLPTYVGNAGLTYTVSCLAAFSVGVHIDGSGSETVGGSTFKASGARYDSMTVRAGTDGYNIVAQVGTWS